MKKETKLKFIIFGGALIVNALCAGAVFLFGIETTALKIIGSFFAVILVGVAALRFPLRFYITALIFSFFASSLGSCVNLYRHISFFDLFVHFLSGILLTDGGYLLINHTAAKRNLTIDQRTKKVFAVFFSCACAAFWEIYEYLADRLINAQMQGTKENTMNDIIAGVLGAAAYFSVYKFIMKIKNTHRRL